VGRTLAGGARAARAFLVVVAVAAGLVATATPEPAGAAPVTLELVAPAATTFGSGIGLQAIVHGDPGGPAPSGTVTFEFLGTSTTVSHWSMDESTTVYVVGRDVTAVGQLPVTATYSGDSTYATATASTEVTSGRADSWVHSLIETGLVLVGEPWALNVTTGTYSWTSGVVPPPATGAVTVLIDGVPAGSAPLAHRNARVALPGLTPGSHQVEVVFPGDPIYDPSSWSATVVPTVATVALTMASSNGAGIPDFRCPPFGSTPQNCFANRPSAVNEPVRFTVLVGIATPSSPTSTLLPPLTGAVTFRSGTTVLATLPLAGGGATFTTTDLAPGSHQIWADFSGPGWVAPASIGPISHRVDPGLLGYGPADGAGYWMLGTDARVYGFGDAPDLGTSPFATGNAVDIESTPSGHGYWVLADTGGIAPHGDAVGAALGAGAGTLAPGEHATSLSRTPSGRGLWVFTDRGRVLTLGDARSYGDMSDTPLNSPVLDSVATPTGLGYYMVASDGGVFAFGDARFHGSMGGERLNAPVQALVPTADGGGYWLVASDGGVFAFDAPFRGSMGGTRLNRPITGMVPYADGYLMVAEDGGIFTFSSGPFLGSLGDDPPSAPITSAVAFGG
jgi:hypothetical protein